MAEKGRFRKDLMTKMQFGLNLKQKGPKTKFRAFDL
jgi:hypothetical protein